MNKVKCSPRGCVRLLRDIAPKRNLALTDTAATFNILIQNRLFHEYVQGSLALLPRTGRTFMDKQTLPVATKHTSGPPLIFPGSPLASRPTWRGWRGSDAVSSGTATWYRRTQTRCGVPGRRVQKTRSARRRPGSVCPRARRWRSCARAACCSRPGTRAWDARRRMPRRHCGRRSTLRARRENAGSVMDIPRS